MRDDSGEGREVHHHHYAYCWPWVGRSGVLVCGGALVIIGVVWLLSNLGLLTENWWEVVVPALLIAWGAVILWSSRSVDYTTSVSSRKSC